MDAYPLRNIDDDVWHRVKVRAMTEKLSVRDVLVAALEAYADGDFHVFAKPDDTTLDARGTTGGKATTAARRPAVIDKTLAAR